MKKINTILKFELDNYFKSKGYMIATCLIAILVFGIMFVPRFFDDTDDDDTDVEGTYTDAEVDEGDLDSYAIYDKTGTFDEMSFMQFFGKCKLVMCASEDEIKDEIGSEDSDCQAGFVINSKTEFEYFVYNKDMNDYNTTAFDEYMSYMYKLDYCITNKLDVEEFLNVAYVSIDYEENILGKDSEAGFGYCYILVIVVFMLIIMYGTSIASSVTNEKSNRSIEILVTSTSSSAILFGKVLAGTIATVFQVGIILFGVLSGYKINQDYWGGIMDMFLDVPADVLIVFAVFGIGGFLMYAFMYGALGALVSKIEDLNKTAGMAQMIVSIVYIVVLVNLTNIDGIIMKVASFLPISSYSAMFARVAMGQVKLWEIIVSAVILYVSVVLMGFIGGKIFRASTLRYGNPIKLTNALKNIKKND